MKLLVDAGNTRIKWAVVNGNEWLQGGALPVKNVSELTGQIARPENIRQAWISNVAGEKVAQHIRDLGIGQIHSIAAQKSQCGVSNGYSDAAQLGSDRWAALIAAWQLVHGRCLVVNSGTATTVDALSAQGEFLGGLILPGLELMQRSLADATDRLKTAPGNYTPFPQNTADALYSGAIQASCGAIERQKALLGNSDTPIIVSGGAAGIIQTHLDMQVRSVENLVLQGLLLIAQEASAK